PFFGLMRLSAIDVQIVRNFAAEMVELVEAGELAPKTVNNTLSCLSTCLKGRRRAAQDPLQPVRTHRASARESYRTRLAVPRRDPALPGSMLGPLPASRRAADRDRRA